MPESPIDELSPSQVRSLILEGHELLRIRLIEVSREAGKVLENADASDSRLRSEIDALLEILDEHMALEERILVPALLDTDSWGEERANRFRAEHDRQREIIFELLEFLERSSSSTGLGLMAWGLVEMLRRDMQEEERVSLKEDVLRDDLVNPCP